MICRSQARRRTERAVQHLCVIAYRDRRSTPVYAFPRRRRLGDREPYRAVGADGAVSVPDRGRRRLPASSAPRSSPTRSRNILLEAWPTQVAEPIAREIHACSPRARGDVLTIGVVLAIYFASSGVESLRIGLNRAYDVERAAQLVAAAAGIDRLCAGRRGRAAGAGVPDRAGAADLRDRGATTCRGSSRSMAMFTFVRFAVAASC